MSSNIYLKLTIYKISLIFLLLIITVDSKTRKIYYNYDSSFINDTLLVEVHRLNETINNNYIRFNVYWFTNTILNDKIFFGISQTNTTYSDIKLCKIKSALLRCDDYYMNYKYTSNITNRYINNFTPLIDYKHTNGEDNILSYNINPIINSDIGSYNNLLDFTLVIPEDSNDDLDLKFNKNNNLTIFFGNLTDSDNKMKEDKYIISKAVTRNFSYIYDESSMGSHIKLNSIVCILLVFVFYLI